MIHPVIRRVSSTAATMTTMPAAQSGHSQRAVIDARFGRCDPQGRECRGQPEGDRPGTVPMAVPCRIGDESEKRETREMDRVLPFLRS